MFVCSFTHQVKSNVVSLDSHIGQYAVICEKQRQEVIGNDLQKITTPALELCGSFLTIILMSFWHSKILQLKQKLKAYEEKNVVPSASNTISSQKQKEFKR